MIISSNKLFRKYKAQRSSKDASASTDSLALSSSSESLPYPRQSLEVPVPETCPAPFPSPSPAMQELAMEGFGLTLVLPPPPPSPPAECSDVVDFAFETRNGEEDIDEGREDNEEGLERIVTAIYSPEGSAVDQRKSSLSDTDLSRIPTIVRRTVPPESLVLTTPTQEKYSFDSPSTSQCPTPRPQSMVDVRQAQSAALGQEHLRGGAASPRSNRFPQSSHESSQAWTASLADRTRSQTPKPTPSTER